VRGIERKLDVLRTGMRNVACTIAMRVSLILKQFGDELQDRSGGLTSGLTTAPSWGETPMMRPGPRRSFRSSSTPASRRHVEMSVDTIQTYPGSYVMPSVEHATVSDAMHPGILACNPEASCTELARMMATHHVHCIAVMGLGHDSSGESLVWGIVSDLDLVRAGVSDDDSAQTAGELARRPFLAVEPTTSIREAAQLMLKHDARHLIVVDPGTQRPTGILSTLDIAGILAWGQG
jgi:CBS domain-containing protein